MDRLNTGATRLREALPEKVRSAAAALAVKPAFIKITEMAVRIILGALLGSARIFGASAPFGPAFVASSGAGAPGLAAFFGVVAGALLRGGFTWSVKYVAISALIYASAFMFRSTKLFVKTWFMPTLSVIVSACTGFVYAMDDGFDASVTAVYITEVILTGAAAWMFTLALSPSVEEKRTRDTAAVLLLAAAVLASLSTVHIFSALSVGRAAAVIIVLAAASRLGVKGCAVGAVLGLAMDAAAGSTPFFTAVYALAAVFAGLFVQLPRTVLVVAYVISNAGAAMLCGAGELTVPLLAETFAASVIFMLIPSKLISSVKDKVSGESGMEGAERLLAFVKSETENAAEAISRAYEMMKSRSRPELMEEDITGIFDMAACTVCESCPEAKKCWQSDCEKTRSAFDDVTPSVVRRGELREEDLPPDFRSDCVNVRGFTAAVNSEYRALRARRMFRRRLAEARDGICEQYMDMEALIRGIGENIRPDGVDRETEKRIRLYLDGAGLELKGGAFRDAGGRMHIELHGAGAGEARRDGKWLEKLSAVAGVRLCEDAERSDRGSICLLEAEPLAVSVGIASMRKKGQEVSGDTTRYFRTEGGLLCVILSDGMGSGEKARADSLEAVGLLEGFLKAGVEAALAMRLMSTSMAVRGEDTMGSAAVDLLCMDLFTGETGLYKFGAAPTYVKREGKVKRIACASASTGITGNLQPDYTRLVLKAGQTAVIASDGVAAEADDVWLKKAILDGDSESPRELARKLLEQAVVQRGAADDMTVLTVMVSERK